MAVRPIDAMELKQRMCALCNQYYSDEPCEPSDCVFVRAINEAPTLTPPNEPLPVLINDEPDREYIDYICPRCKDIISQRRRGQRMETVYQCKFHDNCGQRVDWSDPRPCRRPPEQMDMLEGMESEE